jgi:hypothetical protein
MAMLVESGYGGPAGCRLSCVSALALGGVGGGALYLVRRA